MTKHKEHQRSGFKGCRLLFQGVDPHRQRPAKYFHIPGEFALVGYSDDTDTFLIPAANNGFLPREVTAGLAAILSGKDFQYQPEARRQRRPLALDDPQEPAKRGRRALHV